MKIIILFLITTTLTLNAVAWGDKAHNIVACIAEQNLDSNARAQIYPILDGRTFVYYAKWMDYIREEPGYTQTWTWHFANVDKGMTYETMEKNEDGDIYTAISMIIDSLRNRENMTDSAELFYVKSLIHFVGDIHCPMHAGRKTDQGGNQFEVTWDGQKTNLHKVWDDHVIEHIKTWSYSEWAENICYKPKQAAFDEYAATIKPKEWLNETVEICTGLYEDLEMCECKCKNINNTPALTLQYAIDNYATLELQLLRGGYRLAALLNDIYK